MSLTINTKCERHLDLNNSTLSDISTDSSEQSVLLFDVLRIKHTSEYFLRHTNESMTNFFPIEKIEQAVTQNVKCLIKCPYKELFQIFFDLLFDVDR